MAIPPGARRTQEERSAETQQALLDATVDCLLELGYARTTTRVVAERAGVSRGAQTHHYPTRDDLVVAAVERLFDTEARRFVERFEALPAERRNFDEGIGILWEIVSDRTYPAILEMIVAGRTDPELRVVVHGVAAKLERTVADLLGSLFPDVAGDEGTARVLIDLAFSLVQGAAVASYGGFGDPEGTVALVRSLSRIVQSHPTILKGLLDARHR